MSSVYQDQLWWGRERVGVEKLWISKYLNHFPLPFTLLNRISYLAFIRSGFPFNRVNPLPPVEGRFAGCLYSSWRMYWKSFTPHLLNVTNFSNISSSFNDNTDLFFCPIIDGFPYVVQKPLIYLFLSSNLNPFGLYSPPLAASSSFRRKPESRRPDWIPHQVRNDRI